MNETRLPWEGSDAFHALFATSPAALALSRTRDGRFVEVNDRMCGLYGFRREEMLGRTSTDLGIWGDAADRAGLLGALQRDGRVRDVELSMRHRDGSPLVVLTSIDLVERDGESWMLSSNLDITQRKRTEAELRAAREELARKERVASLGTFVMGVAHVVNNPLQVLRLNTELTKRALDKQGLEDLARVQERSLGAIERLARVGAGLQAIARVEAQIGRPTPVDLNALVRNEVAKLPGAARVVLRLDARSVAQGDAESLGLVVRTLVENALQASEGDPATRVEARTLDAPEQVVLEVEDHGRGIGPEEAERIFTPFHSTKHESMGLALATAHRVVGAQGGELSFQSAPGAGTTFRVRLPRHRPV